MRTNQKRKKQLHELEDRSYQSMVSASNSIVSLPSRIEQEEFQKDMNTIGHITHSQKMKEKKNKFVQDRIERNQNY
ncbi:MAG: hypothetical protein Ta2E_00870 [Mycoplasmoidaceae bacterium]|nr:MAG: hypothetical protein Ta2E_00870 [Mycoplasmoidaceae bacterium]